MANWTDRAAALIMGALSCQFTVSSNLNTFLQFSQYILNSDKTLREKRASCAAVTEKIIETHNLLEYSNIKTLTLI